MDEMKDLEPMNSEETAIPAEEAVVLPEADQAPQEVFDPAPAPATVTDEQLQFIGEQLNDNWLEEFLQKKQAEEDEKIPEECMPEPVPVPVTDLSWLETEEDEEKEIGADMLAVAAAGLVAPEDRELEQILAEAKADTAQEQPQEETAPKEAFPVEEELPVSLTDEAETAQAQPEEEENTEEAVFEEEIEAEPIDDGKKRRPKMKKGYGLLGIPHVLVTVVWLALIVMIAVPLGRLMWMAVADVMAFDKPSQEVVVTITEEDTAETVAQKLGDADLIRFPWLFQKFADLTGKGERIDPGTYTLNSRLDYNAMLNGMVNYGPVQEVVTLMFPEGYNCAQIFAKLEENGVCSVADLEAYAASGELNEYWFLEGVERGSKYCLEGYLAPDTYEFYTNDDPGRVLEKFLDAFDARFTDKMKEDFEYMKLRYAQALSDNGYGQGYIDEHPLTLHKMVTLASIVQKETANDNESYGIASVFYNRLTNPADHPYLGSDATVYYAIGDYFGETEELTSEQLAFDSPYNTRSNPGLPPGPICNPGAYSLYAAIDPDHTDYYYFVYSAAEQKHLFSRTLKEHEQKLKELGLW